MARRAPLIAPQVVIRRLRLRVMRLDPRQRRQRVLAHPDAANPDVGHVALDDAQVQVREIDEMSDHAVPLQAAFLGYRPTILDGDGASFKLDRSTSSWSCPDGFIVGVIRYRLSARRSRRPGVDGEARHEPRCTDRARAPGAPCDGPNSVGRYKWKTKAPPCPNRRCSGLRRTVTGLARKRRNSKFSVGFKHVSIFLSEGSGRTCLSQDHNSG